MGLLADLDLVSDLEEAAVDLRAGLWEECRERPTDEADLQINAQLLVFFPLNCGRRKNSFPFRISLFHPDTFNGQNKPEQVFQTN